MSFDSHPKPAALQRVVVDRAINLNWPNWVSDIQ